MIQLLAFDNILWNWIFILLLVMFVQLGSSLNTFILIYKHLVDIIHMYVIHTNICIYIIRQPSVTMEAAPWPALLLKHPTWWACTCSLNITWRTDKQAKVAMFQDIGSSTSWSGKSTSLVVKQNGRIPLDWLVVSCFTLYRQCSSHVTAVLSLECDEKFNISRIFQTLSVPVFLLCFSTWCRTGT